MFVPLQIHLQAELERFMFGKRSFDEYGDFIEECRQHGAEDLLALYRARTVRINDRSIFALQPPGSR